MTGPRGSDPGRTASFEALRESVAAVYGPENVRLLERAYQTAARAHEGQRRRSGDPYITHPVIVAGIVADAGASAPAICAALLHDVVEDTPYAPARLRREFGSRVADLVDGLHRRDALQDPAADPEVVLLTLADRLHNLRTIRFLGRARQQQVARETLERFVPLADRIALPGLRTELADRAAATLGWPELRRRAASCGPRLLATGAMLLPAQARLRWFEEWLGEFSVLPSRRARARFALQTLRGVPWLAITLHRRYRPQVTERGLDQGRDR